MRQDRYIRMLRAASEGQMAYARVEGNSELEAMGVSKEIVILLKVIAAEIDDLESRILGLRSRPDEIPGAAEGELEP